MPYPFLFFTLAFASGILFSSQVPLSGFFRLFLLLACFLAAWLAFLLRRNRLSFVLVLSAAGLLGMNLYSQHDQEYQRNTLRQFDYHGYADFSGRLYKSPSFGPGRTYLYLKVEKIHYANREERAAGNLRVTVLHTGQYPSPLKLQTNDAVRVAAQVLPARDFRNFGEPRLANLRKSQNVHNHAITKSALLVEILEKKQTFSILRLTSAIRQKLLERIEANFSSPEQSSLSREGAVLEALLLGERGRMDEATTQTLQKSGLYHLIAISGAHIAILSYLLFSVFRLFRTPKRAAYVALIVLLLFYTLLVEGRASVFRATIMTLAYIIGKLFWRNAHVLNAISFSAFFILLANPFYLFEMGFELTFAATLSIILFYPPVLKFLPRLPLKVGELLALSLTAQLGVLPFLASSFNRIAFSSVLLNFAAVPLTGVIMAAGFIFLIVSLLSHWLGHVLVFVLTFLIRLLLSSSHLLDSFSFFSYRLPTPHLATICGYFVFLFLLLLRPSFKGQKLVTFLCFGLFLAVLVTFPFPPSFSRSLRLTFLDVGQGDSILVEFPGRKKMIVDGGGTPDKSFDIGENVVSPFLWRKGIKKIDYLVLTHAHPDHLNGLTAIARNFRIIRFWEAFSPPQSPVYDELKRSLGPSVEKRRIFRGFSGREGNVRIEALHPEASSEETREASNEDSLVLRVSLGESSFLLASDIGMESEEDILQNRLEIASEVLKSPHHGSRTSSSLEFLKKVAPRLVVISCGRGNTYGVPHPDILDRYKSVAAEVLRTDEEGAVEISGDGASLVVRTARQAASPH